MSGSEGEIDALLDTLLPGDGVFPAASGTGIRELLLERLGGETVSGLHAALEASGGPLAPLGQEGRHAVVSRLEQDHAPLFEVVLRAACLGYYGSEPVAAAIRATGLDYHLTPQPKGYAMEPFDPVRDTPRHRRGRFLRTDEIRRVELPEGIV